MARTTLPRRVLDHRRGGVDEGRGADVTETSELIKTGSADGWVAVTARGLLPEAQRDRFADIAEMDTRELARHHTLSEAELAVVSVHRGAANRPGFAVQFCLLRNPVRPLSPGGRKPRCERREKEASGVEQGTW